MYVSWRTINRYRCHYSQSNVDSEENNSEGSVIQFHSKEIGVTLNIVNNLQNLILNMDPDTEKVLKIQSGLGDLFTEYHEVGNLKAQIHKV